MWYCLKNKKNKGDDNKDKYEKEGLIDEQIRKSEAKEDRINA